MLCEKLLGNIEEEKYAGKRIDYVTFDWHEIYNKINRKTSAGGRDVAIHLDDGILKTGLKPGDVLAIDEDGTVIACDIAETQVLAVTVNEMTPFNIAKMAHEIGNCHAPLFGGQKDNEFITLFNEPMEHLLSHLSFVTVEKKTLKPDFKKQISSVVGHGHHH